VTQGTVLVGDPAERLVLLDVLIDVGAPLDQEKIGLARHSNDGAIFHRQREFPSRTQFWPVIFSCAVPNLTFVMAENHTGPVGEMDPHQRFRQE
jgi:hypothetical protein